MTDHFDYCEKLVNEAHVELLYICITCSLFTRVNQMPFRLEIFMAASYLRDGHFYFDRFITDLKADSVVHGLHSESWITKTLKSLLMSDYNFFSRVDAG